MYYILLLGPNAPASLFLVETIYTLLQVVAVELLNCLDRRQRRRCCLRSELFYCVKGYSVYLVGFVISQLYTEAIKNQAGRLRPNFIDVCKPEYNVTRCTEG